jgi:hypothetical protein
MSRVIARTKIPSKPGRFFLEDRRQLGYHESMMRELQVGEDPAEYRPYGITGGPVGPSGSVWTRRLVFVAALIFLTLLGTARLASAQTMMPNSTVMDPNILGAAMLPGVSYVRDSRNGVLCYFLVPTSSIMVTGPVLSCVKITTLGLVIN